MKKIMLLITLFFILPALAFADKIILQDGTNLNGHIISEDKLHVLIDTIYGKSLIKKAFIKSIEYENISSPIEKSEQTKEIKKEKLTFNATSSFSNIKPILPPKYIVDEPNLAKKSLISKRNDILSEYYFCIGFSFEDLYTTNSNGKNNLSLYGISLKLIEWNSVFALGMNAISKVGYPLQSRLEDTQRNGTLKWTTIASTMFVRYPDSYISPYLGIGLNYNFLKYKDVENDNYMSNIDNSMPQKEDISEELAGGNINLGIEVFISKFAYIEIGFKKYYLGNSEKSIFKELKDIYSFYLDTGLLF